MEREEITHRIARFPEQCRRAGLKVTHQRMAVYGMLAATDTHPTPEDVYMAIRGPLPSISLGTVYKILDQFQQHGFLRRVSTEGHVARYDANLTAHHHLICEDCGKIQDVELPGPVQEPQLPAGTRFRVSHCDILFHGRCGACAAARPTA
jgi:Fur family peroxide stress response transcriptional regulator